MKILFQILTLVFLCFSQVLTSYGQTSSDETKEATKNPNSEYHRVLSYKQMWLEILTCKDSIYGLKDVLIEEGENDQRDVQEFFKKYKTVHPYVKLQSVTFIGKFNSSFKKRLPITISVSGLKFEHSFTLFNCEGIQFVKFKNTTFDGNVNLTLLTDVWSMEFDSCLFRSPPSLSLPQDEDRWAVIRISNSSIILNSLEKKESSFYIGFDQDGRVRPTRMDFMFSDTIFYPKYASIWLHKNSHFSFNGSSITSDTSANWFELKGEMSSLNITNSDFGVDLDLSNCEVHDKFNIRNHYCPIKQF